MANIESKIPEDDGSAVMPVSDDFRPDSRRSGAIEVISASESMKNAADTRFIPRNIVEGILIWNRGEKDGSN